KDVERLEAAWLEQAQPTLLALGISLALAVFMFLTGQSISLILFIGVFISLGTWLFYSNRQVLTPLNTISTQQEALRSETVQALTGLPEVIAYEIRSRLLARWQQRFQSLAQAEQELVRKQAINGAIIQGLIQFLGAAALLAAIPLINAGTLSAPTALATILLLFGAVEVYQPLARTAQRWWETRATVARMQAIENTPLPQQACQGNAIPEPNAELTVEGLG